MGPRDSVWRARTSTAGPPSTVPVQAAIDVLVGARISAAAAKFPLGP